MTISAPGDAVLICLLSSLRIVAWLTVAPPFSYRAIPVIVKVGLSVGLALAVTPLQAGATLPTNGLQLGLAALSEVLVGLSMGFVTSLIFSAVAAAGGLVDVFGGFALAQAYDPISMRMNTVFGQFHQLLAFMLLFATGGHLVVVGGLLTSFETLPLGASPNLDGAADVLITAFKMFWVTAVQIAAPLIAVLFVADIGLALLTKIAPQLNALSVMFPAKIGLTLMLFGLSLPVLSSAVSRLVEFSVQATAELVGAR